MQLDPQSDAFTIMAAPHPDRWTPGSRDEQYAKLNEIVERLGSPLKQQLMRNGAKAESLHPYLTFCVKNDQNGDVYEIEGGVARLDYDPTEARREANAYNSEPRGFDRALSWNYTYTLCGRVHGYFKADEWFQFSDAWQKEHGSPPPRTPFLLLHEIKLRIGKWQVAGFP